MSLFKEIETTNGIELINAYNVSYIDKAGKLTRIVMNDGTVFFVDSEPVAVSLLLGSSIDITFDPNEVHTKKKKGSNKHGKTNKNS